MWVNRKIIMFQVFCLLTLIKSCLNQNQNNNVCKTYPDYMNNINSNPNCWFDEEINSTPEYISQKYGFSLKRHFVITEDGYILTLFRLQKTKNNRQAQPVLLGHGIGANAVQFMINGNKSLSFFLGHRGFDVWLGNSRGTQYSINHISLNEQDDRYWDFSFHEIGVYDLSATLNYIKKITNKKVIYIGHSMGSTIAGVYATMKPKHAKEHLKMHILLCSAFYMRHTKGLISRSLVKNIQGVMSTLRSSGLNVLFREGSTESELMTVFRQSSLNNLKLILKVFALMYGPFTQESPDKMPWFFVFNSNICMKVIEHYVQLIVTGEFQYYDYGSEKNLRLYNSTTVPKYDFSKFNVPVHVFYAELDYYSAKQDNEYAFSKLTISKKTITEMKGYNHIDILLDKREDSKYLFTLLKLLKK